jgi:ketosteroid isomerase-like protein
MIELQKTDPLFLELDHFFNQYAHSFDSKDWRGFIAHYHEPALSIRGDGSYMLLNSRDNAKEFFQSVSTKWASEGYAQFTTRERQVHQLGNLCALVTFIWEMRRHDGSFIREWRQSYEVVRRGVNWQVVMSTFHA